MKKNVGPGVVEAKRKGERGGGGSRGKIDHGPERL